MNKSTDEEVILQARSRFVSSFNSGDYESVADLWAEDVLFIPPDREAYIGRREGWQVGEIPTLEMENDPVARIEASGDLAYTVGSYTLSHRTPAGRASHYGRSLEVWRRQPAGLWQIVADMWHNLPEGTIPTRDKIERARP